MNPSGDFPKDVNAYDRHDWLLLGVEAQDGGSEYAPTPQGSYHAPGTIGPCSNTGQNSGLVSRRRGARTKPRANIPRSGSPGDGALVDYLSLTVHGASELLAAMGEEDFAAKFVAALCGRECGLTAGEFTGNGFQGYTNSAHVIACTGEIVGRIGVGGNNDTVHFSISGAGCEVINDWQRVQNGVLTLGARLTRVDLAWDDVAGEIFNPRDLHQQIIAGELDVRAVGPGKPPKTRFIDDHGHRTGTTLYAGRKGHKELCIYEKGMQLGDRDSRWVRCEVRFWNKRADLPASMLTQPLAYLRAAYNVCEAIPANCSDRIRTVKAKVEANAMAWARWMNTQVGASVRLLFSAMGREQASEFLQDCIAREGVPGRFKGISTAHLNQFISEAFNVGRRDPVGAFA